MEPTLYYILWICGILGGLILLGGIVIIYLILSEHYRKAQYQKLSRQWESTLLKLLAEEITLEEAQTKIGTPKNYMWMWQFLFPYLESLEGEDRQLILSVAQKIGMQKYYLKKLRQRWKSLYTRALAARILGSLHCYRALPLILSLLNNQNQAVVISAARSITDLNAYQYLDRVAEALLQNTQITYEGATEIMAQFSEECCPMIMQKIETEMNHPDFELQTGSIEEDEYKMAILAMMVDLLGYYRWMEASGLLSKLLPIADEETIIHIFKAFIRMDTLPPEVDLKHYLTHPNWVIRSLSARAWNIKGSEEYLSIVVSLLDDPFWWVRLRAAEALWSFGLEGKKILQKKAEEKTGASAAISQYILAQEKI